MRSVNMKTMDAPIPLIAELPSTCANCGAPVCLREQVLNLALGQDERIDCLPCLAELNDCDARELFERLESYIKGRECFNKQWVLYTGQDACYKHHLDERHFCF
ncbi:MAG: hypothetical protein K2X70_12125 [Candidatus Obscuribacterales bacterium]|nr:hypothetical protein [Candidatus Obscuribacterales bacterium]